MIDALNANAQEGHLIALHAVCRAFDLEVDRRSPAILQPGGRP
jgi:D-sedoheptulose 7-phosphate isomerase